jgi:hypothetical protein
MIAEEFEAHWSRLSFEGRRLILEGALEEICSELGMPTPPLIFASDFGFAGYDESGEERKRYGATDTTPPFAITIHYNSTIEEEGDREQIDDPWAIMNTLYHEFVHYMYLKAGLKEEEEFNVKPGEHPWQISIRADQLANQFYDDIDMGRRTGRSRFRLDPIEGEDFKNPALPINDRRDPPGVYHRPSEPTNAETSRPIIEHMTPISTAPVDPFRPFGPFGMQPDEGGRSRAGEEMQRQVHDSFERMRRERENFPPAPPMPHETGGRVFEPDQFRHRPEEQHRFPSDLSGGGSGHMTTTPPEPSRLPDPPLEPIPRPEHRHHHVEPPPPPPQPQPQREEPVSPVINVAHPF